MQHTKYIVNIETNFSNKKLSIKKLQARNQEFFRTRDISWNEGTSINNLLTTNQREASKNNKKKNLKCFLLNALKTAFHMRYLTYRYTQSGYLFPKPGHFFRFSEKK